MFFIKNKKIIELQKQNEYLLVKVKEVEKNEEVLRNNINKLEEQMYELNELVNRHLWEHARDSGLFDEPEELDFSEPCICGGILTSMYDEHPNWIKYCLDCDRRIESGEFSPI